MTKKEAEDGLRKMANAGVNILRKMDIQLGAMDENWEPVNHLLSAKENERCWKYLAEQFIMNVIKAATYDGKCLARDEDSLFSLWLSFLQTVEGVVRYGHKNKGIENIVNGSGISRETFIMFLD